MDDDTITNLADYKAKQQIKELDKNKETDSIVNPKLDPEMIKDLDACIQPGDMEATLRVFEVLRTMGEEVNIKVTHTDIYLSVQHVEHESIDAGVDFPEQVIKASRTEQTSTINFEYKEEEWDSLENFFYNVGFSLSRCIEALTYWGTGDNDENN